MQINSNLNSINVEISDIVINYVISNMYINTMNPLVITDGILSKYLRPCAECGYGYSILRHIVTSHLYFNVSNYSVNLYVCGCCVVRCGEGIV